MRGNPRREERRGIRRFQVPCLWRVALPKPTPGKMLSKGEGHTDRSYRKFSNRARKRITDFTRVKYATSRFFISIVLLDRYPPLYFFTSYSQWCLFLFLFLFFFCLCYLQSHYDVLRRRPLKWLRWPQARCRSGPCLLANVSIHPQ